MLSISAIRNCRQVLISAGVGLFCGGTQCTALPIRQSTSCSPSSIRATIVAAGKSVFEQGRIEQVAGIVAGERPPGAVGALQSGRETDDQQRGIGGAERGNRRIEPVRLARAVFGAELARRGQSGQSRAGDASGLAEICASAFARSLRRFAVSDPRSRRRLRRAVQSCFAAGTAAACGVARGPRAARAVRARPARTGRVRSSPAA